MLVAQSCLILCDPVNYNLPGSFVHGISRHEYLSGLPFPSPGDLPNPGIKPQSPALQADSLPSEPPGKPHLTVLQLKILFFILIHEDCLKSHIL